MMGDIRIVATYQERTKAMQEFLTPARYEHLIKYSIVRLLTKFNIRYNVERGFRGIMVEDMISDTIASFLKQDGRNWYKDKHPTFIQQFFSALDSVISNTMNKELEQTIKTFEILDSDQDKLPDESGYQEMLDNCNTILDELGASDEEKLLFEPYIINGTKRDVIANLFGIPLNELTNIKKKLDRKMPALRARLKDL